MRLPPSSTLFPYTTLFRSCPGQPGGRLCDCPGNAPAEIGARTTKSECDGIECGSGRSRRIWGTHDELPAYARCSNCDGCNPCYRHTRNRSEERRVGKEG